MYFIDFKVVIIFSGMNFYDFTLGRVTKIINTNYSYRIYKPRVFQQ